MPEDILGAFKGKELSKTCSKKDSGRRLTPATISGGSVFSDFPVTAKAVIRSFYDMTRSKISICYNILQVKY
jgi:NADH:ubiquinone oxidoreductase subunit D